jgi:murein DD-endopeptidase MepM/ murein hydrolase activator NlpD
MGRLARVVASLLVAVLAAGTLTCSHAPNGKGVWHVVKPGDTLWRLSQRYETSVDAIRDANDDIDARSMRVGQKLWMPRGGAKRPGGAARSGGASHTLEQDGGAQCGPLAKQEKLDFEWPVLGRLTSAYGVKRGDRDHDGIDLRADEGTPIHAAEAGRVVYAGDDLGDYGKVIIIKHMGRWATVYAHNRKNQVDEGAFVEKGDVIAEVGETGNASAPHLHFEVRRNNAPRDPQSCLP